MIPRRSTVGVVRYASREARLIGLWRDGARLSYDELNVRATTHTYAGGVTIRVAALADIVASKQWANRPKDHRALPELEALQRFADLARRRQRNPPGRDLSP